MFRSFFDLDNHLWRTMSRLVDVLVLCTLWFFLSLPLITAGPATAALYDASVRCLRRGEVSGWRRFFKVFFRELPMGALLSLVWLVLFRGLFVQLSTAWAGMAAGDSQARLWLALWFVLTLLPTGMACWMFPLLSRFSFRLGGLLSTSARLALGYLPWTVLMVLTLAAALLLGAMFFIPFFLLPAPMMVLWSLWLERIFKKYAPTDENTEE